MPMNHNPSNSFFHLDLTWVKSLNRLRLFRYILTIFVNILLDLSLLLGWPSTCIEELFFNLIIVSPCWICPNYLKSFSLSFSPIEVIPKYSWILLFCDFIFYNFTIYPFQVSHLCCTHYVHMLILNWPTFYSINHNWSHRCLVSISQAVFWAS